MKSSVHTVSMDMLLILQHFLIQQGSDYLPELDKTLQELSVGDDRVTVNQFADIWQKTLLNTEDENFGLHFGQSSSITRHSGILYPVMMNCPTLYDALEKQARYHNLVTNFIQLHLENVGDETILYWVIANDSLPLERHLVESIFCSLVLTLHEIGRGSLRIHAIHFMHPAPDNLTEHERIFQCALLFNQNRHAIHFDAASLTQPLILANPQLLERFEQVAREMQAQQAKGQQWTNQVTAAIRQALMQGQKPQLAAAADGLHLSARQLQNKLNEGGASYQEVLDETRKSMALDYLRDPQLSVCQIAFLLGFSEQSTFNHAFKRWTGQTPGVYRNQRSSA